MEEIEGNSQTKNYTIIQVLIAVLLAFPTLLWAGQFKVVRVYDGDTLKAVGHNIEITIRLVGIDAPELPEKKHLLGQPFCTKAKEQLADLVLNKVVDIKFYGKDRRGRPLGEVFLDRVNINLEMIHAGVAEVYRGKLNRNLDITAYRDAERKAKESLQGIWVLRDQYFSPWDWREIYR